MITQPRTSSYVRMDEWDQEAEKWNSAQGRLNPVLRTTVRPGGRAADPRQRLNILKVIGGNNG